MANHQDTPSAPPAPPQVPVHKQTPYSPPQHPAHAGQNTSGKMNIRIAVIAAIAVLAVVLLIFLLPGKDTGSSMEDSIPTQRQMVTDAKTALSNDGIDCQVLNLEIENNTFSERFKTYTADCTVTISIDGTQSERTMKLFYEYVNDQWKLVD